MYSLVFLFCFVFYLELMFYQSSFKLDLLRHVCMVPVFMRKIKHRYLHHNTADPVSLKKTSWLNPPHGAFVIIFIIIVEFFFFFCEGQYDAIHPPPIKW